MPRAADAKKVVDLPSVALAFKRKAINVSLNLETALYEVRDAKKKVVKTFKVTEGYDAAYLINTATSPEEIETSGGHLKTLQTDADRRAADAETSFAETQDDLMRNVILWRTTEPGTARSEIALEIGRLQHALATNEAKLRNTQYKYREVLDVIPARRRLYEPLSFDDRSLPYPVYKINQHQTTTSDRVVPSRTGGKA